MRNKDIYIYFDDYDYHNGKTIILETKIDIVKIQKRLESIKKIRDNKIKLIEDLNKYTKEIDTKFKTFFTKMSAKNISNNAEHKKIDNRKSEVINDFSISAIEGMEEGLLQRELLKVQEQLKKMGM